MYLANHVLVVVCILEEAQARGSWSNESTLLSEVYPRIDTSYSYRFETKPGKLGSKRYTVLSLATFIRTLFHLFQCVSLCRGIHLINGVRDYRVISDSSIRWQLRCVIAQLSVTIFFPVKSARFDNGTRVYVAYRIRYELANITKLRIFPTIRSFSHLYRTTSKLSYNDSTNDLREK